VALIAEQWDGQIHRVRAVTDRGALAARLAGTVIP
jgi:hypothetical protein